MAQQSSDSTVHLVCVARGTSPLSEEANTSSRRVPLEPYFALGFFVAVFFGFFLSFFLSLFPIINLLPVQVDLV